MKLAPLIAFALLVGLSSAVPTASAAGLQGDVDQAATIVKRFKEMPEQAIPEHVMKEAKGLAILTAVKAGFFVSGEGG